MSVVVDVGVVRLCFCPCCGAEQNTCLLFRLKVVAEQQSALHLCCKVAVATDTN